MEIFSFIKGLAIGFSIAAAVGPVAILCFRRTLSEGFLIGLCSGLGAAAADTLYSSIAAFGMVALSQVLIHYNTIIRIVGGLYLLYLGWKTYISKPAHEMSVVEGTKIALTAFVSIFFLTLTNPATILGFTAIFSCFGFTPATDMWSASSLITGVFFGSTVWWIFLASAGSLLRSRITIEKLIVINKISGCIIAIFGLSALLM